MVKKGISKWLVCYIDSSKLDLLERDLASVPKYRLIRAYIPTVKVLTKQFKGKKEFKEVPMLFNYGFFRVPSYFIYNPSFLLKMKADIRCIYGIVKDPNSLNYNNGRILPFKKNKLMAQNPSGVALASDKEIINLIQQESLNSIHSDKDIGELEIGKIITLNTYPFEGLEAEIIEIDEKKKMIEVRLLLQTHMSKVKVSFDNVLYTVYKSDYMNNSMKEQSLEDIKERLRWNQ